jgi:hypothetical protein
MICLYKGVGNSTPFLLGEFMLVLTRKEGESIIIDTGNDKIEIILTEINGSSARIGIEAKADINIENLK